LRVVPHGIGGSGEDRRAGAPLPEGESTGGGGRDGDRAREVRGGVGAGRHGRAEAAAALGACGVLVPLDTVEPAFGGPRIGRFAGRSASEGGTSRARSFGPALRCSFRSAAWWSSDPVDPSL
jgi:hypothetical protein